MSDLEKEIAEEERRLLLKRIQAIKGAQLNTVNASAEWNKMVDHALKAGFDRVDFHEKLKTPSAVIFTWKTASESPRPDRMEEMRTVILDELSRRLETPKAARPDGPPDLRIVR